MSPRVFVEYWQWMSVIYTPDDHGRVFHLRLRDAAREECATIRPRAGQWAGANQDGRCKSDGRCIRAQLLLLPTCRALSLETS